MYGSAEACAAAEQDIETVLSLAHDLRWVRLKTIAALDHEGELMAHCIGRGAYDRALLSGRAQFYSLRGASGRAWITVEVRAGAIRQCRGSRNRSPLSFFRPAMSALIRWLSLNIVIRPDDGGRLYLDDRDHDLNDLPDGLLILGSLDLSDLRGPLRLPNGLKVTGNLNAAGCDRLAALPMRITVDGDLDVMHCADLSEWDGPATIHGDAWLHHCAALRALPPGLFVGGTLDLTGCVGLTGLPRNLRIGGDLVLTGCPQLDSIREVPGLAGTIIREAA